MAARLEPTDARWWVTGGCAAALRGSPRRPGDLDIECHTADAEVVATALGLSLRPCDGGGISSLRAMGRFAGVPVDLTAGLVVRGSGGRVMPDDDGVYVRADVVMHAGFAVRVQPAEEAFARALASGNLSRMGRAVAGLDRPLDAAYVARRVDG